MLDGWIIDVSTFLNCLLNIRQEDALLVFTQFNVYFITLTLQRKKPAHRGSMTHAGGVQGWESAQVCESPEPVLLFTTEYCSCDWGTLPCVCELAGRGWMGARARVRGHPAVSEHYRFVVFMALTSFKVESGPKAPTRTTESPCSLP